MSIKALKKFKIRDWQLNSTSDDFEENYQYLTQDEVQEFHWINFQSTLHPVIIYNQGNNELEYFLLCYL